MAFREKMGNLWNNVLKLFKGDGESGEKEKQGKAEEKKERKKASNKFFNMRGGMIFLVGIILVLSTLIAEEIHLSEAAAVYIRDPALMRRILTVVGKLVEHLGVALIILGLVSVITDFDEWRKYFQERLAETIVKRDYLETLEEDQLLSLQTDTLKAFFNVEDIDRKGSFLEYFHEKIRDYIGSPYREDTNITTNVTFADAKKDTLVIEETTSYECRKVGKFIQEHIQWFYGFEDVKEVNNYEVRIEIPKKVFESPEFKSRYPNQSENPIIFLMDNTKLEKLDKDKKFGFKLSVKDYNEINGLKITIDTKYVIEKSMHLAWKMTQPSKRVLFIFTFPEELEISSTTFGIAKEDFEVQHKKGFYSINYDSWMLPYSGVAFQFSDKKVVAEVASSNGSTAPPAVTVGTNLPAGSQTSETVEPTVGTKGNPQEK